MLELIDYPMTGNMQKDDLDNMLYGMLQKGGSDLFIKGGDYIWLSIYGRKEKVSKRKIKDNEAFSILSAIYGDNARTLIGSKTPVDMQYEFKRDVVDGTNIPKKIRYRFRVNAVGCLKDGINSVVITFRGISSEPKSAKLQGVEPDILELCKNLDQGLILVVGATGNGKSTLLTGIVVDQLTEENGNRNIVTIEAPIEAVYDSIASPSSFVTQMEVGTHVQSFADGLRNTLRMAPSTIVVGEARDYETISCAIEASVTGHVVYSTVHASSVAETFQRMIAEFPSDMQSQARFNLIQSIKLVVAQRLIPSTDGKRIAIREYLIIDQAMKDLLLDSVNLAKCLFKLVDEKGKSMMRDITEKYNLGLISEEVFNKMKVNYLYKENDSKGNEDA
jgi:defect-in-organelle-trafficking protein DotB